VEHIFQGFVELTTTRMQNAFIVVF